MVFTINQHCSDVILFFVHATFSRYLFNFRNAIKNQKHSISLQLAELTRGKGDRFTGPLFASGRLATTALASHTCSPTCGGLAMKIMANGVQPLYSGLAVPASRAKKSSSGISTAMADVRTV